MPETSQTFGSYGEASKGACTWIDHGKSSGKSPQIRASDLVLYPSKMGPAKGRVVGLGIKRSSGVIEDFVRIDQDDHKGIHFNAKFRGDTSKKFAATIRGTDRMDARQRDILYNDYLNGIANRSAAWIWEWWSTGQIPKPH